MSTDAAPPRRQRARGRIGGRPGGQDIVDEEHAPVPEPRLGVVRHAESALEILLPLRLRQPDLLSGPFHAGEKKGIARQATVASRRSPASAIA